MELQTITPEYTDINRLMHERDGKYGAGSWRWGQKVMDLRDAYDANTVLDYGCGKGNLFQSLACPEWMSEYDPAIPGKNGKPKASDLIICTDVLEHIEPDLLENVLEAIVRVTRKVAFFCIATRKARSTLPDGTNPHKIVENADWWAEKIGRHFFIVEREKSTGECHFVAVPVRQIGQITSKSAVSETTRYEQALINCKTVKERVDAEPRHDGRVCIVAFGPSLKHTWHTLRHERKAFGAKIVSVSGSHDFLIERGIIPDYHIEVDPREHKGFFTRNPHPDVTYWPASCCHPTLINNLVESGCKLALWHVYNSDTDRKIVDKNGPDPDGWLICGGGSVGCRAVNVMYTRGYRTFSMYGMDCSFDEHDQHAGPHSGKKHIEWNVRSGDRWFRSSANLVYTARGFFQNLRVLNEASAANDEPFIEGTKDRVEMFFNGDGLLQSMAQRMNDPSRI